MPLPQLRIIVYKGYKFDITPVLETNKFIFCAVVGVPPAGGEGEIVREPGRWLLKRGVGDEEDYVVEVEGHGFFGGGEEVVMIGRLLDVSMEG